MAEQAEGVEEEANGALDDEVVAEQAEVVEEANDALDDEVMVEQAERERRSCSLTPDSGSSPRTCGGCGRCLG